MLVPLISVLIATCTSIMCPLFHQPFLLHLPFASRNFHSTFDIHSISFTFTLTTTSSNLTTSIPQTLHIHLFFKNAPTIQNSSGSAMITISIEPDRLCRATTQPFRLMKTSVNCIFIVLGSTGNAYILTVSNTSISCTCPDSHPACKHILFLLLVSGFSGCRQLTLSAGNLLQKLHAEPPPSKLRGALLDEHTNNLCSAHNYPSCFFCNQQPSGTLTICSSCGFLSHKHCFQLFLLEDNDSVSHCPRCGMQSSRLSSHFIGGHRNFFHILCHQGYRCLPLTSMASATTTTTNNNNNNNVSNQPHVGHADISAAEQNTSNDHCPDTPELHIPIVPESAQSISGPISISQPPQDL